MQDSWVIYVCKECGAPVADGETRHVGKCSRKRGFEEVRVVRADKPSKPELRPFGKKRRN